MCQDCSFSLIILALVGATLFSATEQQLDVLAKAETWYVDATYKVAADPFEQLFSIHAFMGCGDSVKQVPLIFAMMSRKLTKDYVDVFNC